MGAVIKCWGPAHDLKEPIKGEYLKSFDPEAHDGRGEALFTRHIKEAMVFTDAMEAIKLWQTQSVTRPLRDDGKKNRPLTAFSASFENI
jgi:hypothetical protein